MIRAILKNRVKDVVSGAEWERFETVVFEAPLLEQALQRGGYSEAGFDITELVGLETFPSGVASAMPGDATPKDAPIENEPYIGAPLTIRPVDSYPDDGVAYEGAFSGTRLNVK